MKGFTLIELLIVIAIIAILAAIIVPAAKQALNGGPLVNNDPAPSSATVVPDRPAK